MGVAGLGTGLGTGEGGSLVFIFSTFGLGLFFSFEASTGLFENRDFRGFMRPESGSVDRLIFLPGKFSVSTGLLVAFLPPKDSKVSSSASANISKSVDGFKISPLI